jgi:hypothetical protein
MYLPKNLTSSGMGEKEAHPAISHVFSASHLSIPSAQSDIHLAALTLNLIYSMDLHIWAILGKPQHQYSLYPKKKNKTVAEVCQGQIRSECPGRVSDYR